MTPFNNLFNRGESSNKEEFPKHLYNQIAADNGKKTVVLSIEMANPFPSPPFVGPVQKAFRNNQIIYTKIFNGALTITREYLKIDNSRELHAPEFDLGYESELDYTLEIYMTSESWMIEYFDKNTKQKTILPFEQFLYYGGK